MLDECQEIRSSTTVLARQCAALSSDKRWMMSGTPLHNSISDLNGELAFLQVIPFSLSDTIDGFWCVRGSGGRVSLFDNKSWTVSHRR